MQNDYFISNKNNLFVKNKKTTENGHHYQQRLDQQNKSRMEISYN